MYRFSLFGGWTLFEKRSQHFICMAFSSLSRLSSSYSLDCKCTSFKFQFITRLRFCTTLQLCTPAIFLRNFISIDSFIVKESVSKTKLLLISPLGEFRVFRFLYENSVKFYHLAELSFTNEALRKASSIKILFFQVP